MTSRAVKAIDGWWRTRLAAGCQLTHLHNYRLGYDYRGLYTWKHAVAITALHADFLDSHDGPPVSRMTFMVLLRRRLGQVTKNWLHAWLLTDAGRKFIRPRRSFIRFGDLDYHRAMMKGALNANQHENDRDRYLQRDND